MAKFQDNIALASDVLIDEAVQVFQDNKSEDKTRKLVVTTNASRSGKIINHRVYPGVHVKSGAKTFFKDGGEANYNKPFLKNHDVDSEPLGRVIKAEYKATLSGKRWQNDYLEPTSEGSGVLVLTSEIIDEEAQEKFLNGTYQTVSIGGSSEGRYCSKCSKDSNRLIPWLSAYLDDENEQQHCDCYPGEVIDGERVYLITGSLRYNEVSQVNVPADDAATHIGMEFIEDSELTGAQMAKYVKTAMAHRDTDHDSIVTPSFSIVDAQGNELVSLNSDSHKPTKTSVVVDVELKDKTEGTMDHAAFAEARVLKQLSTYGLIGDGQCEKIDALDQATLTDAQKDQLDQGFYVGPNVAFVIGDQETLDASLKLSELIEDEEAREAFVQSVTDQAATEELSIPSTTNSDMTKDDQIKSLTDKLSAADAQVADLEQKLTDKSAEYDKLHGTIVDQKAEELVDLRVELSCHDAKELTDESRKELKDKYLAKGEDIIDTLIEDLQAEKAVRAEATENTEANVEDTDSVENPLTDSSEESAEEPKASESTDVSDKEESDSDFEDSVPPTDFM